MTLGEEETGNLLQEQERAPLYYQVGIIPQAALKPIQLRELKEFFDELFDVRLPIHELR